METLKAAVFASFQGAVSQIDHIPPRSPPTRESFVDDFRRFFVRGLSALLPTLITLLLLLKIWEILWDYLGSHIIWLLKWVAVWPDKPVGPVKWYWEHHLPQWLVELIGVGLAIVLVYIIGLFIGNFIGRTAWRLMERTIMRAPLVRAIYPHVKQVTDFVLNDRKSNPLHSSRVVAVQPHASGIWSVGLVTGGGIQPLAQAVGTEMVTVFIPSSPTAFSGYVVVVPRHSVVELPLTVEEAMRLLLTNGVITPGQATEASGPIPLELPAIQPAPGARGASGSAPRPAETGA